MRKLIRADFSRLWHDRIFWLLFVFMAFSGVSMVVLNVIHTRREGVAWVMDFSLFTYATLAPILTSVFTSLFVGSDYAGGTLRNQLIVGHRRWQVYFSHLLTCCCAGVLLCGVFALLQGGVGWLLGGIFQSDPTRLLLYGGLSIAMLLAFTSLFVLIAMLCQSKSYTAAGCILLTFVLVFLGVYITSALNEPAYLTGYSYTENGVRVEKPDIKNPNYVSGIKRQVYVFMKDFVPGGQMLQISAMNVEKPISLLLYDGIILLAATGLGMVLFRRKNLR